MIPLEQYAYQGKYVLLRVDINSPVDAKTKKIVSDNRIRKSIPTIRYLLDSGAKLAIIAHQGDTLDYQNLLPLSEHAGKLSELLGREITYIDDVCGPAAVGQVKKLQPGEAVLLGNLRYLTEEVSGFEKEVKLEPREMLQTWLVRTLAPLFDLYVNDAFAAAHRNSPSMVAFQELLPTAAGRLLFAEYSALSRLLQTARSPVVFVLGGAKISDAFGMIRQVLENNIADRILTCGVTGQVFLLAAGYKLGQFTENWIADHDFSGYIDFARQYLERWRERIALPQDLVCAKDGQRLTIPLDDLPQDELFADIGPLTQSRYLRFIEQAGTIFVNGPAGMYENKLLEEGTRVLWQAISSSSAYTVIGGGDSVSAADKFSDLDKFSYVCTAGGAMVRFISGRKLPLIQAMEKAWQRDKNL